MYNIYDSSLYNNFIKMDKKEKNCAYDMMF